MNVWIRVSGCMNIKSDGDGSLATNLQIASGLDVTVYATKARAKEDQDHSGGIVLEVDAKCLADVENEFGKDVLILTGGSSEGKQSSRASIFVCCDAREDDPEFTKFTPG